YPRQGDRLHCRDCSRTRRCPRMRRPRGNCGRRQTAFQHATAAKITLGHYPQTDRILIARFSAMGDIIHSLPTVAAIRHAFPSAYIGWAVEEHWKELLSAGSPTADLATE